MKKRGNKAALTVFIIGFLLFMYPLAGNIINAVRISSLNLRYSKSNAGLSSENIEEQESRVCEYNKKLALTCTGPVNSKLKLKDEEYESLLDSVNDGIMAFIDIPSVSLTLPVYHYCSDSVLEKGAGHVHGSSMPVGGIGTHTIIIGHRGLPSSKLFTDLDELKEGDLIYIRVLNEIHAYSIYDTETILPSELNGLSFEKDRDLLTLVTCTPYGINTHRLLIKAERTEYYGEDTSPDFVKKVFKTVSPIYLICGIIFFIAAICVLMKKIKRKRKHE